MLHCDRYAKKKNHLITHTSLTLTKSPRVCFVTQSYLAAVNQHADTCALVKLDSNASLLITCLPSVCCSSLFHRRDVKLLALPYTPKPSTAYNPVIDTCTWQAEIISLKFLKHLNSYFTGEWIIELLHKHKNWNFKRKLDVHSNRRNNPNS